MVAKKGNAEKRSSQRGSVPVRKAIQTKATIKKAPVKVVMFTTEEEDKQVAKIVALLWTKFEKAALLPVDDDCFDEAVLLGALANVRTNIDKLYNVKGPDFKASVKCVVCAAQRASSETLKKGGSSIDRAAYKEAFNWVARGNCIMANRNKKNGKVGAEGYLC